MHIVHKQLKDSTIPKRCVVTAGLTNRPLLDSEHGVLEILPRVDQMSGGNSNLDLNGRRSI